MPETNRITDELQNVLAPVINALAESEAANTALDDENLSLIVERGRDAERLDELTSRKTVAEMVAEFHAAMGDEPHELGWPSGDVEKFRLTLIEEEFHELAAAIGDSSLIGVADALADLVYVIYGTAYTYGINLDRVLAEVHRSNMTKDFGGPMGDRKARKGDGYEPPDISGAINGGAS